MKKFINNIKNIGINLSENQLNMFQKYYEMLVEKNKVMNLTAITDYQEVLTKHFLDSLTLVKVININKVEKVIDVGTGGGFPGIPLKIAFPHLKITLLDSLNKRVNWLNEVIAILDLDDIKAVHGRAEEFGQNFEYREQYDLCVSRAVANLSTLSEYCMPFVKKDGYFVSYKAATANEELKEAIKAIEILGGKVEDVCSFNLEDSDMERCLIKIVKIKNTSKKYPRKAGLPSKEPIK
ncbi:MAG: 16S rRNA (guanine(527)-N(7))-methyltransferase RsmG [Lachnospiraceae bacterium]|nr:16S rRNA (guanine(527)-N(7))-methyltransferase RsmG [Lachnospiraceae bacterium]